MLLAKLLLAECPNQQLSEFTQLRDSTLSKISSGNISCVLAGDFNIDMAKYATHTDTANYIDNVIMNNFMPTIIMPTHESKSFASVIDSDGKSRNSLETVFSLSWS